MGGRAEADFGISELPQTAIMFAGGNALDLEDKIVGIFDHVLERRHGVYHTYIVKKQQMEYSLLFQVYGSALAVDGPHILHDGGRKELLSIGVGKGNILIFWHIGLSSVVRVQSQGKVECPLFPFNCIEKRVFCFDQPRTTPSLKPTFRARSRPPGRRIDQFVCELYGPAENLCRY